MAVNVSSEQVSALKAVLLDTSGAHPLHERFRALFTLKAVGGTSPEVVDILGEGLDKDPSDLLKHELAYVLGQIGDERGVPVLEKVVKNEEGKHGEMVRHEAAEALGALSSLSSIPLLTHYLDDAARSVRETCRIAIDKIEWDHNTEEGRARVKDPNFPTIDPAPPVELKNSTEKPTESVATLRAVLLDTSKPLFERYRAMFGLRNVGGKESVKALADGFGDESALFRHEVAYIFGQLSSPHSIPSLLRVMRDQQEDEMVRHEAAEALGGIASDGVDEDDGETWESEEDKQKGVLGILREWSKKADAPTVVRESCQIAVDMFEYENSNQFQYADKLAAADEDASAAPTARLTGMDRGIGAPPVVA